MIVGRKLICFVSIREFLGVLAPWNCEFVFARREVCYMLVRFVSVVCVNCERCEVC